jgi:hypothetical protein
MLSRYLWQVLLITGTFLTACGEVSEVHIRIIEGAQKPCLGAAHMHILVESDSLMESFDRFGKFFSNESQGCKIARSEFAGLSFATGVKITVEMLDSTSVLLARGDTALGTDSTFDVARGDPQVEIDILLNRLGASPGTIVVQDPPSDWQGGAGVDSLSFEVKNQADGSMLRSGDLSYGPENSFTPFPVIISDIVLPSGVEEILNLSLRINGKNSEGEIRKIWTGSGDLGQKSNPIEVLLEGF